MHSGRKLAPRLMIGTAREVPLERITSVLLVKRHGFDRSSSYDVDRAPTWSDRAGLQQVCLLTVTEPSGDLLIRARRAHADIAADPGKYGPVAEQLVAEARRARQPEALALALRALAWAERARLDDRAAIRLLDEACGIARRHHLDDTLGDLLMSHADVSQELGRIAAAHRDLRAAAVLVSRTRSAELDIHRAVLLQNIGQLAEAQAIYHRILADPRADPQRAVLCANNLALIESQQRRYDHALRRLEQAPARRRRSVPRSSPRR
jgi:tetratricopeptide (TPR) repeat protein